MYEKMWWRNPNIFKVPLRCGAPFGKTKWVMGIPRRFTVSAAIEVSTGSRLCPAQTSRASIIQVGFRLLPCRFEKKCCGSKLIDYNEARWHMTLDSRRGKLNISREGDVWSRWSSKECPHLKSWFDFVVVVGVTDSARTQIRNRHDSAWERFSSYIFQLGLHLSS
jgi:hypothetical protein